MTGAVRSYRPGAWFGVFGEHATVLLPPTEKARVPAVWALVDDGDGFDEVLDVLIADGLRDLPGFVLVSETAGETRVVIRGAARATLATAAEEVTVEGTGATTWVERALRGVTGLRIEVGEAHPESGWLDLGDGLVRVSEVVEPVVADELPAAEPEADEASLVEPPPVEPAYDEEPATPEPTAPTEAVGVEPLVVSLLLPTGETVEVDRPVLVGRAPDASRLGEEDDPRLVTVPSPDREISATHLEVRPGEDPGSAVVTDLGSTNGSVLVQPGMPPEELQPGVAVPLLPGAVLDLGDGVAVEVVVS
ncbi:FHA domain-containing protein [Nocardioides euryhalodurans]|uniref:FHA domain-containing protein n=1 Tax=Nocardioides euryhalodurans TaxID=2518370 RepID=A0A4P7GNL1_9ACTN|nr:FHA domain-containing protein [Nocardioides euryhalodurans]QBR93504.1 FHA domain-containing protein [Nocardioides euryhalodurans]